LSGAKQSNLLMAFVGDDFTGSTDAMESLARHGIRTVLFTNVPTAAQLERYKGLQALGVAGLTRSLPTDQIAKQIEPIFVAMRDLGAPIVHYKTCSTFDSSPAIGSIGRVIDVGMEVFGSRFVPVVVGAPALGRYCVFGNLFARCGGEPGIYRLDRHPSMSRHPITPMDEADLRVHLGKQTSKRIGLLDAIDMELLPGDLDRRLESLVGEGARIVLMDVLYDRHLDAIGAILAERARRDGSLFVAGSSGVESALCAHWMKTGGAARAAHFERPGPSRPIIALAGSCSPVTGAQIGWAVGHGFAEIVFDGRDVGDIFSNVCGAIRAGRSVCVHTGGTREKDLSANDAAGIGAALGRILARALSETGVRRVVVAGGDTSSQVARALGIEAVEMMGELTRGVPLCKASSSNPRIEGLEIAFKGGQIGNEDFFGFVEQGREFQRE
jgi:3-oxoisoapionate kinase